MKTLNYTLEDLLDGEDDELIASFFREYEEEDAVELLPPSKLTRIYWNDELGAYDTASV